MQLVSVKIQTVFYKYDKMKCYRWGGGGGCDNSSNSTTMASLPCIQVVYKKA